MDGLHPLPHPQPLSLHPQAPHFSFSAFCSFFSGAGSVVSCGNDVGCGYDCDYGSNGP